MVNDNDDSGMHNYLTKTIREDGKLVPIDDPDVKTYSYALYNCEYCHVKVFLSLETKAIFNTPNNSKVGIILVLWNKPKRGRPKKGKRYSAVTKKAVCWNCFKAIWWNNFGNQIFSTNYVRPESTKEHIEFMEGRLYR